MTKEIKKSITKEKILEEAMNLFAKKGYEATSMSEVADAVGVKKSSLYYFFDDKESLLVAVLEYVWGRLADDMEKMGRRREEYKSNREHFADMINHFISKSLQGGLILGAVQGLCPCKPSIFSGVSKKVEGVRNVLSEGLRAYKVKDPGIAEEIIINASHAYIFHRQHSKTAIGVKKYADYLASLLIKK